MPLGFAAVAGVAAALGTRPTMLAASLVVLGLLAVALAVGDVPALAGAAHAEVRCGVAAVHA